MCIRDSIYGREEVGGLLLGCFDRNATTVRPSDLPEPFEFALLNENWDQFMPYMREGIHRIPALQTAPYGQAFMWVGLFAANSNCDSGELTADLDRIDRE